MKRFLVGCMMAVGVSIAMQAQTYTEHVQQHKANEGSVTIRQSKDIDDLVNGKRTPSTVSAAPQPKADKKAVPQDAKPGAQSAAGKPQSAAAATTSRQEQDAKKDTAKQDSDKKKPTTEVEDKDFEIPVIDTRKKVMRNSYKVNGYRVQVYAGGNARKDRQKAEEIGAQLKMSFPTEPVYVHFYSPRWICRIGNYRTAEEASRVLKQIQGMGFKQACLVRGKITVQY